METIEVVATVGTPTGLHARPATQVLRAVQREMQEHGNVAVVFVNQDNAAADPAAGDSILSIMVLAAALGHKILIKVTAATATIAQAIAQRLQELLSSDLDAAPAT